jgi:hypothetical protein
MVFIIKIMQNGLIFGAVVVEFFNPRVDLASEVIKKKITTGFSMLVLLALFYFFFTEQILLEGYNLEPVRSVYEYQYSGSVIAYA